jgi:hypothetical protein
VRATEHHGEAEKGDDAPKRNPTAVDILSPLSDPRTLLSEIAFSARTCWATKHGGRYVRDVVRIKVK